HATRQRQLSGSLTTPNLCRHLAIVILALTELNPQLGHLCGRSNGQLEQSHYIFGQKLVPPAFARPISPRRDNRRASSANAIVRLLSRERRENTKKEYSYRQFF